MSKYQCEMFGQLNYGDILTYEELQEVEGLLIPRLDDLLQQAGAAHVDFTPTGDVLLTQCVFEAYKLYIFRKLAQELAGLLPEAVRGNLFFLQTAFQRCFHILQKPCRVTAFSGGNLPV